MTLGVLLASVAMQSCSDDDMVIDGEPLKAGSEIHFGATLPDDVRSRTYYGEEADNKWPIYWSYLEQDEIFIYSPQAMAGRNQATYRVLANVAETAQAVDIEKTGDAGIQTGSDPDALYKFYAVYPASAVSGSATETAITGSLSGSQTVTLASSTEGKYVMSPDMKNCLMIGTEGSDGGIKMTGEKVPISFKPFATTLDITVNGPKTNSGSIGVNGVTVTSVVVTSTNPIVGDFTYDPSTGTTTIGTETGAKTLNIPVHGADDRGVTLKEGETLNLQAFILPNANVNDLKIQVVSETAQTWTKTLTVGTGDVAKSNVLKVSLPKLDGDQVGFDYSIWLSQMNDQTYIADISLPGAALFVNTSNNITGNNSSQYITQSLDLEGLFNAGIRVFQAHIQMDKSTTSAAGDGGYAFKFSTSNGTLVNLTLFDVLTQLSELMASSHADEFCVLVLSDYGYGTNVSSDEFYSRLRDVTNYEPFKNMLITDFSEETTIADAKGKIIIKYQLNTKSGAEEPDANVNTVNSWLPLNGSQILLNLFTGDAGANVLYSPMTYGQVGSEITYTDSNNSTRPTISSDKNTDASLMWYTASRMIASATWSNSWSFSDWSNSWRWQSDGTVDMTAQPTDLSSGFWFIFGEQANAGSNQTAVNTNITNAMNAIKNTWSAAHRNKYYMTYCGGAPESSLLESMTNTFNETWLGKRGDLKDCPYGWVMLNQVGDNTTTTEVIKYVIEHNTGVDGFTPGKKVVKDAPAGDSEGAANGGSLM